MKTLMVLVVGLVSIAAVAAPKPRPKMTAKQFLEAVKASPVTNDDGGDCSAKVESDKTTVKITVNDGKEQAWVETVNAKEITHAYKAEGDGSYTDTIYLKNEGRVVITHADDAFDSISVVHYFHKGKKVKVYTAECELDY